MGQGVPPRILDPTGVMPDTGQVAERRRPPATAPRDQPRLPSGPAARRLGLLVGAVLLVLAASFAAITQRDHEAALEDGWSIAERAAYAAAEHAERSLAAAHLITDRVAETVRREGPDAYRSPAGQAAFAAMLRDAPQIGSIWVLDPAGRLAAASLDPDPPPVDVSDRPFFAPLRGGADSVLSPLLFGRISDIWFFAYNRAVRGADGAFVGIVQASIHAAEFQRFQARLGLGPGGRVGLFRASDGVPLMLHPLPSSPPTDPSAPEEGLQAEALRLPAGIAPAPEGRFEATGPGGERLLVAWRVAGEGERFIATAALPRAAALAPFRDRLVGNALLFGFATAMVAVLAWGVATAVARSAADRRAAELGRREVSAVLEATGDGVFAVDSGWRITFLNRQGSLLLGRGQELVGMELWDAFEAAIPAPFGACFRQTMEARLPTTAEAFWVMAGARLRIDVHPRADGGIVVFFRDVTAAHEAARRVADSEARLRRVLDSVFSFVAVLEPDGTLLEANRGPLQAAGVTLAEVRGRPFWDGPWWRDDQAARVRVQEACRSAAAGATLRFDLELRDAGGRRVTLDFQIAPLRDEAGRVTHLIPSATDVTARIAAEEALAESETRLRLAQEAAEIGVFERVLPGEVSHWSASLLRLHGLDPATHGPWMTEAEHLALIHPADRAMHVARRGALRGDPAHTRFAYEVRIRRADTGEPRWIASRGEILRDPHGRPALVRGVNYDVTERRRAEERQMLLAREVDHRAKNALAVVQSIVALTRDTDPERFRAAVTGRIAALARAHTLLARDGWDAAGLRELLEQEVAPYRGEADAPERVTLDGPDVALAAGAAQPLAMALHELATNAAKYGALSRPGGFVALTWELAEDGGLVLRWSETGGPPLAEPPARRGFGSSVIRNTVERQLGGHCRFDWRPEGLACTLDLPATQLRAAGGDGG